MKDILSTIGKIFGYIFAVLVIGYTATLTFMLAGRLVPGNLLLQLMTVCLFDGAALTWFVMFITQAKGTMQWAIAGIGFTVGLIGAVIMVAGELILGQSLVVFNDPTKLGWVLITTVIVACVCHVSLVYLFHLMDPTMKNRIEIAQKVADKIERAYCDARKEIDRQQDQLTAGLTDSIFADARMMLESVTAVNVRNKNRKEQINREIIRDAPIIPGISHDPILAHPPMAARPDNNRPPIIQHNSGKKHQRGPARPMVTPAPGFGGNGHSAEHNAFAASPIVTTTEAIKESARNSPPL